MSIRTALVMAVTVGLLVACSSPPPPSDEFLAGSTKQEFDEILRELSFPHATDPSFAWAEVHTQVLLINECLREAGVRITNPPAQPEVETVVIPRPLAMWAASGDEYGVARALSNPTVIQELRGEEVTTQDSPDDVRPVGYDDAAYGDPPVYVTIELPNNGSVQRPIGGCFGEATRELYGVDDPAEYERAYYAIPSPETVLTEALSDGAVRAGRSLWSQCMYAAGYPTSDPTGMASLLGEQAVGVVSGTLQLAELAAYEQSLAGTDRQCKIDSGLGTAFLHAFVAAGRKALEGNEGVVVEYRAMMEHAQAFIAQRSGQ